MGACVGRTRDLFDFAQVSVIEKGDDTFAYRELPALVEETPQKTLIYLHSLIGSAIELNTGNLLQQISNFAENYRIIALDFKGSGNSPYNSTIHSLDDLVEDVKNFIDTLQLKEVDIMGACLGGLVGTLFALKYPDYVNSLIMISPLAFDGCLDFIKDENKPCPTKFDEINENEFYKNLNQIITNENKTAIKKQLEKMNPKIVKSHNIDYLLDEITKNKNLIDILLTVCNTNITEKSNANKLAGTGNFKKLNVPTMVLVGDQDTVTPKDHIVNLKNELPKEKQDLFRVVILKGAQHLTWYDDLDHTSSYIKKFLEEHKGRKLEQAKTSTKK